MSNPECAPSDLDTSYLASPEFVVLSFHIVTILTVPVLTFGAYCILFKTPSKMKSVKLLMLNVHFWSALSDITISFFGVPYAHFPALAGYGLGIVDAPGFMFYCSISLILALTASILAIYENRYYTLFGKHSNWRLVRRPYLILTYISVPFIFLPPYLNLPDQESSRRIVLSTIPCLPKFTYSDRELFVLALDVTIPFLCIASSCVYFAVSMTSFFILTCHHLLTGQQGTVHSFRTMAIQKSFLIAITIQSAFTIFIVLAPVLLFILMITTWYHNQKLNNFICLVLSTHGVGSTMVMILVHKPYREFAFSWCSLRSKTAESAHDTKTNTTRNVVF